MCDTGTQIVYYIICILYVYYVYYYSNHCDADRVQASLSRDAHVIDPSLEVRTSEREASKPEPHTQRSGRRGSLDNR